MWVRLKMGGTPKKKMMAEKYEKKGVSSSSRATHIACEILGYPQLLGHHAGHNIIRSVSPHRVPQSLIFTCPASQNWECGWLSNIMHWRFKKKNRSWHVHTRTCRPMYQVSGRHACSAFVAAVFSMAFRKFLAATRRERCGKPPGLDHWVALHNLPKDHMLSIQVTRFHRAEEELAAVGVWAWNQYAPETKQRFCILQYCELLWTFARQVDKWFPFAKVSFNAFSEVPLSPKGDPSASRLHWPSTEFRRPCV